MIRPRPRPGPVLVLAALLAAAGIAGTPLAPVPAAGHGVNSATLDPQVTADGVVYVETAFLETDGWIAARTADGAFVGHARVERAGRVVTDVPVPVSAEAWTAGNEGGVARLRMVTYAEDGDGAFDPDADRELVQFGGPPDPVPVARGANASRVLAATGATVRLDDGAVPVRLVVLPAPGHVVVRNASAAGGTGAVLGSRALAAGTHRNVTVPLADPPRTETAVAVAVHRDDGDGTFEPGDDAPIRAGNATVATRLSVAPPGAATGGVTTATPSGGGGERIDARVAVGVAAAAVGVAAGTALVGVLGSRRGWW